jgi:hypothetical protein
MPDPNAVTAYFGQASFPGQIVALEGQRGLIRARLHYVGTAFRPEPGGEGVLEMHDGSRFRVTILEQLSADDGSGSAEVRMRLLGRDG